MALLTCHDVAFAYEGRVVVSGIQLTVEQGDYLCIVGDNGSGKSTLVKGLLGLMEPSAGTIQYGDGLRRTGIGYLPQKNATQKDFPASVWEVVTSGFAAKSLFLTGQQKKTAEDNMTLLHIFELKRNSFMELSGGQQQRVLLARALCATHQMLLLDEPVAGLDPVATQEMYEAVETLHQQHGVTIVMISHDLTAAMRYAKHILHLQHEPLFYGTAEEYAESAVCQRYLGVQEHA